MVIAENILEVRQKIATAALRGSKDPRAVKLVAVTKTVDIARMEESIAAGVDGFGENKVQELVRKYASFPEDLAWHLIGHLQTNKVKQVVGKVSLIHSLDSVHLAREISRVAESLGITVAALVQVNVAGEESKFGLAPNEVRDLLTETIGLTGLRIRGLMTIAPLVSDPEETRPIFRSLANLAKELAREALPGVSMDLLSMGMTNDFEVAVEEGANIVRVGSAIFGTRT